MQFRDLKIDYPKIYKHFDNSKNLLSEETYLKKDKRYWWLCPLSHSFQKGLTSVLNAGEDLNCTVCNSLGFLSKKLLEEWDFNKNEIDPYLISKSSSKKVKWKCIKNHRWEAVVNDRYNKNSKCPYCAKKLPSKEYNLKKLYPKVSKYFDINKNKINPENVLPVSKKMYWWTCDLNHSYQMNVQNKTKNNYGCPLCSGHRVSDLNSIEANFKHLLKEWDYKKNTDDPSEIPKGRVKKYWWKCSKGHEWEMSVNVRTHLNQGCPYCATHNSKLGYGNDLLSKFPDIAKEWNYDKNEKTPSDYKYTSIKKIWWKCSKGDEWETTIASRTGGNTQKGTNCPYCTGKRINETNSLASVFPELLIQWDYDKNEIKPEEIHSQSRKKVWWKCNNGHSFIRDPNQHTPSIKGKKRIFPGCPFCYITPRSKEEVYLTFELMLFFNINIENHKIYLNEQVVDIDIILEKEKIIVEYDGSYWHKDIIKKDIEKAKKLNKLGWTVIRAREKPLKKTSKYDVLVSSSDYKNTANQVLKRIQSLGIKIEGLSEYLNKKDLNNKTNADLYIEKLQKENLKKNN